MSRTGALLAATFSLAALFGMGIEPARAQGFGDQATGQADAFAPSTMYPGVREFRWKFHIPSVTFENREAAVTAPTVVTHARRWDYLAADIGSERRSIGKIPEFSCKYPDLMLPNECRTVWRDVYVDLPALVERRQHIDVDVPEWRWQKQWFPVLVPRWTWNDRSLTISVPAMVTEKP